MALVEPKEEAGVAGKRGRPALTLGMVRKSPGSRAASSDWNINDAVHTGCYATTGWTNQ